jgi:2-hydroxy-6-oxonona-2,4-dienedioate hydrolase
MTESAETIDRLASEADVRHTPCGAGHMVWRTWGAGEPVVLCHGGSGSWTHWIKTIPALRSRYEVWVPDLPGLGDSAMPPKPGTPATCGTIVADGIRWLIAERRAHLVGFSFGAHVGTFAAAELGYWLMNFTICGCAALGLPPPPITFPRARPTMGLSQRRAVHRKTLEILMFAKPARIDDLAVEIQTGNIGKARFRSREFARTAEIKTNLARVRAPLRAIWGEHDAMATPSVEACFEALRLYHPELVTRVIPDAGHWVMYEQAEAFNAALIELLQLDSRRHP